MLHAGASRSIGGGSLVVASFAAAAVLAGCGSRSTTTHTKTVAAAGASTPSATVATSTSANINKAQAGKAYLGIAAPLNATLATAKDQLQSAQTGQQGYATLKPFGDALTTADNKLSRLADEYPAAASDIKALIRDDSSIIGDVDSSDSINSLNLGSFENAFAKAGAAERADVNIVRSDLGLPQRSN